MLMFSNWFDIIIKILINLMLFNTKLFSKLYLGILYFQEFLM